MALTDIKVRSAKPQEKEYTLVDGDGMFLLIHPNGSKYWRFRWTDPTTVDISCPHDEACSKASGLTPPRWL